MADQFDKLWVQPNLNQLAVNRAKQAIKATGRALPCSVVSVSGSFVTVKFEINSAPFTLPNITIPKVESQWIRSPTQVGEYGITIPADAAIGFISGQGGGVATLAQPGNLAALLYVPIASKHYGTVDKNAAYISGPDGVVLQDQAASVVMDIGGGQVTVAGNVFVTGNLGSSSGVTGSFTTPTGQTVTVTNGLITNIF